MSSSASPCRGKREVDAFGEYFGGVSPPPLEWEYIFRAPAHPLALPPSPPLPSPSSSSGGSGGRSTGGISTTSAVFYSKFTRTSRPAIAHAADVDNEDEEKGPVRRQAEVHMSCLVNEADTFPATRSVRVALSTEQAEFC
mmetsp:Transcript_9040/g.17688  ORF Transcript_9040/g.17688 Transcript_9040/m.17688 type:complete len:140 (-) Transcript_9040:281-700(-)